MKKLLIHFAAILSLLAGMMGAAQAQTPTYAPATGIRVLVYGIHYGGNLVYHYKVINNSNTPFNNFTIGSHFYTERAADPRDPTIGEYPQLTRMPLGWSYGERGEIGVDILLPPGSTSQPPYWTSWIYGQQEASSYYLEWQVPRGDGSNDIHPGQTLAGFSVTVPLEDSELLLPMVTGSPAFTGPDEMYIKGGFKVGFGSEKKFQQVWGTLEREDVTPPTLTVTLSPSTLWPPNDKLIPVTATITVHDDYDPAPEIRLEAITVNETASNDDASGIQPGTDDRQFQLKAKRAGNNMAGRIYTVTYSATDGSGNKTMTSATVTVPHDQGKK